MYNRYIKTDSGSYTRIPQEEPQSHVPPPQKQPQEQPTSHCSEKKAGERGSDGITGFLRHMLDQFHLQQVDTGDLLLLLLLFLLFHEDADEEVLMALGILLIL